MTPENLTSELALALLKIETSKGATVEAWAWKLAERLIKEGVPYNEAIEILRHISKEKLL